MIEKIKNFIIEFITALQTAKIYTTAHPSFMDFIDRAYASLQDTFEGKNEIVIGIINEELAFEQEIFFDLSQRVKSLITYFKERGIERIVFNNRVKRDELSEFISFLITPLKEAKKDSQGYVSLPGIKNIKIGKIKIPSLTQEIEGKEPLAHVYEDSLDKISSSIEKVLSEEELDYLDLRFNLLNVMENFLGKYQEFLYLVSIKRKDIFTFLHLLTVSLLSMYISSKLGFSKDNVLDIGIASLFHDIGKISISRRILKKKEKFTEEEFSQVKDHSILGARIMVRYTETLGILPSVVAFEHHIRYDLKGYPKLSSPRKPHLVSMLVSLCDVYDALTQRRIYKRDYPPLKIYNIMKKEKGGLFHPKLLDKFFTVMGVWPVGTIVSLSDGQIAVVREVNEKDIFHPKVEVISPQKKKGLIDLMEKGDGLKIKAALNPFEKGKKYVHLI